MGDNPIEDFSGAMRRAGTTLRVRVRRPEGLHSALPSAEGVGHEVKDLIGLADRMDYLK